jgi:hypothetical protein
MTSGQLVRNDVDPLGLIVSALLMVCRREQGSKPVHENPHMDSHMDPYQ